MFWTRLRSSIMVITITLLVVIGGGNVLFGTLFIVSLIGMMELYRVVKVNRALPGMVGYTACMIYYFLLYFHMKQYQMLLFIAFVMMLLFVSVFQFKEYKMEQIAITFFGLFYVGIMLSYIYQVRMLENGALLVWLIFISSWGSDTCAYCVGIKMGKHKITPKLSPKKTLEGCIGGVLGAGLIGFLYAAVFMKDIGNVTNPQLVFALICAASSVISQIGDLAASAIKREYDIKDYGTLIPGHGGILDRFDSVLFTAPIVYFLAMTATGGTM
jgi:phosphatidate cytidylyltransferase